MSAAILIAFAEAEGAIGAAREAAGAIWRMSPTLFFGVYGCEFAEYSAKLDALRAYIRDQRKTLEDAHRSEVA